MRIDPSTGMTDSENMSHNTIRIKVKYDDGESGVSTGFFYSFEGNNKEFVPAIVTNKHVLENAEYLECSFNPTGKDNRVNLKDNKFEMSIVDLKNNCWYSHPNPSIDLAFIPLAKVIAKLNSEQKFPYMLFFARQLLPKPGEWLTLTALEQIIVVGYPAGVWDSKNNLPILIRGTTATHPKIDYEDRPEFLVSAPVYLGSSGSPVFLYDSKDVFLGQDLNLGKHRPRLVGILSQVFHQEQQGEMVSTPIATVKKNIPFFRIPNNLGIVIKSTELEGFIPLIDKILKEQERT
jgi:hypothetical protein